MVTTQVKLLDNAVRHDYVFKIILIGNTATGKSTLVNSFTDHVFNSNPKTTIQPDIRTMNIVINGKIVRALIYDTAGQERFKSITSAYYDQADGALLVYDVTAYKSYNDINGWLYELQDKARKNVTMMLVGNKIDLQHKREVPTAEAEDYAETNELLFIETSAKESHNVEEAFIRLLTEICKHADSQPAQFNRNNDVIRLKGSAEKPEKKCPCSIL